MGDAKLVARGAEIFDFDVSRFGQAQAAAVDHAEKSFGAKMVLAADVDERLDFLNAEDPGQGGLALGAFDAGEIGVAVDSKELAVEGVDGVDGDVD